MCSDKRMGSAMTIQDAIRHIVAGRHLDEQGAFAAASLIMDGAATPCQIAGLLVGLRMKGETVDEITGFVRAMRDRARAIPIRVDDLMDTCGTGGDGAGTFNISTVSALVAAGAGCRVAKHGNRAVSSRCGSAEVLERLGVAIEQPPEVTADQIVRIGVGFLFAPLYHEATRHAAGPRREIGVRSIFNIVGPLTHPAEVRRQVVGVFDGDLTDPLARVLRNLGSHHCLVLHGLDGLDEISLDAPTRISELKGDVVSTRTIEPEDLALRRVPLDRIRGGDADENARIVVSVLQGEKTPARDVVLANAGAAVYVGGRAVSLREGVVAAAHAIDSGAAMAKLEALRHASAVAGATSSGDHRRTVAVGDTVAGSRFLSDILKRKAAEVAEQKRRHPSIACNGGDLPPLRGFRSALEASGLSVIAEFKRRSPSKGVLRSDWDPIAAARCYADHGAAALSVLTDATFFGGSPADLSAARSGVDLPVLRKDFIVDPVQVHESRRADADAVLLIVRALGAERLRELLALCGALGMDALVEVHTREELCDALEAGAEIIGVNNRDLDTFEVRLETALRLRSLIPSDRIAVAESGIRRREDAARLDAAGFDAILVGETLMTAADPGSKLRELMGRA